MSASKQRLTFVFILSVFFCSAQVPLAEIEGRLSVYLPDDTTSIHIGKNAGLKQDLSSHEYNTFVGGTVGYNNIGGGENSFYGWQTGFSNSSGNENAFFGSNTGFSNSSGSQNSFFGEEAGYGNTSGNYNVFIGDEAGYFNETGNNNTILGSFASSGSAGDNNVNIGYSSGVSGSNNVTIGYRAGGGITQGDNNIIIGYEAGPEDHFLMNNRMFIDVNRSLDPLIYGEFDNDLVQINGKQRIQRSDAQQLEINNNGTGGLTWRLSSSNDDWNAGGGKFLINNSGNTADSKLTIQDNGNVGIGITDPTAVLHINDFMKLEPRSSAPACNTANDEGRIYYDSTDNKFKGCVSNPIGPILFKWVDFH
jgi:hypothetical protein